MKKTLLVLAAAAALVFGLASCGGTTDGTKTPAEPTTVADNPQTIAVKGQWGGPSIDVDEKAASIVITFDGVPADTQLVYISDKKDESITAYEAYFSDYSGALTEATVTVDVAATSKTIVEKLGEKGATKLARVQIQNAAAGENTIKVKKVVSKDADGNETAITLKEGYNWTIQ